MSGHQTDRNKSDWIDYYNVAVAQPNADVRIAYAKRLAGQCVQEGLHRGKTEGRSLEARLQSLEKYYVAKPIKDSIDVVKIYAKDGKTADVGKLSESLQMDPAYVLAIIGRHTNMPLSDLGAKIKEYGDKRSENGGKSDGRKENER